MNNEVNVDKLYSNLREKISKVHHNKEELVVIYKAFKVAKEYHGDQLRRSGEPYIIHPIAVADILVDLGMDYQTLVAALLHDVVEDSEYTLENLKEMGFPREVIEAIKLLSRSGDEPYMEYINRVASNDKARKVKLADLDHNSDLTRLDQITDKDIHRVEKYRRAEEFLKGAIRDDKTNN